jgi:hypothetical protein
MNASVAKKVWSREMSPISFTQQGIVTQYELAKILIITSDGVLEVYLPLTDDDRRDMEIHMRGKFARSIALQVKSTMHLAHRFKAYQLSIFFSVPKDRLISHPNFWYYFGYFDMKGMAYKDPVFIVPSEEVHSHAAPHLDGDRWTFNFGASLEPSSEDRWVPFRVSTHEVGPRVLDIFGNERVNRGASPLPAQLAGLRRTPPRGSGAGPGLTVTNSPLGALPRHG